MTSRPRLALLSFDAEEFDIPLEYGGTVTEDEQFAVGKRGLDAVAGLVDRLGIPATFFVTAAFAERYTGEIRRLAERHEIASHGLRHTGFEDADLASSREVIGRITGTPVLGFRRARFAPTDHARILAAGYRYNSSENPIWLPGRYNNFFGPRCPYHSGALLNIPLSAVPIVRFPLFWLAFKNAPMPVYRAATALTLAADGHAAFCFHPWEFADLRGYSLPGYVARPDGQALLVRLEQFLVWLKGRATFATFADFAQWRRTSTL